MGKTFYTVAAFADDKTEAKKGSIAPSDLPAYKESMTQLATELFNGTRKIPEFTCGHCGGRFPVHSVTTDRLAIVENYEMKRLANGAEAVPICNICITNGH